MGTTKEELIEVFNDTMNWIREDERLLEAAKNSRENSTYYRENEYPAFTVEEEVQTHVTVTKSRSYEAAMRLATDEPNCKIAVMNLLLSVRRMKWCHKEWKLRIG